MTREGSLEPIKLSSLADDVVLNDDRYRDTTTAGELKDDLLNGIPSYIDILRKTNWYIAELVPMQKYRIDGMIENIVEDMDEQCEEWQERYGNSKEVETLRFYMQKAYDEFRESLEKIGNNKVYSNRQQVLIDL